MIIHAAPASESPNSTRSTRNDRYASLCPAWPVRVYPLFIIFCLVNFARPTILHADAVPGAMDNLPMSSDSYMQEGKAMYESGQYMAALGKFMSVLRNDPAQPEARRYLRLVIDAMRTGPKNGLVVPQGGSVVSNAAAEDEIRRMLEKRSRLTIDIQAIPGVKINNTDNASQVAIETSNLFADQTGGLREQGVPALDRIAAWLGTFGQQPVIIHCYPEELQDPSVNGALFLHRYSELYNFFVQERKMAPQRFVSADLLVQQEANKTPDVSISTSTSIIVFETVGTQTASLSGMPSILPNHKLASWLEFSIFSNRARVFNPEEGEWASLDVAALARQGVKSWKFVIVPEGKNAAPVFTLTGTGNMLQRLSWDGHNQVTGSFVPTGAYTARLSATDTIGVQMQQEMVLQVQRSSSDEPAAVAAPKAVKKPHSHTTAKAKPKAKPIQTAAKPPVAPAPIAPAPTPDTPDSSGTSMPAPAPTPAAPSSPVAAAAENMAAHPQTVPGADDNDSLIGNANPPTTAPAVKSAAAPDASAAGGDSSHTIWKQVIQFESGQSDLQPSVKSSLERIGKTLEVYPLQKVRIVGFAAGSEANPTALAKKRAETVRSILVNEYNVDQKRVIVAGGKVSDNDADTKVELSITN